MMARLMSMPAVTPAEAARVAARLFGDGRLLVAVVGRPTGL